MTDMNNNIEETERCPMCPNHCMKGQTKCGRGAAYFGEEDRQNDHGEGQRGEGHHGDHGEHRGHGEGHHGEGHHGEHDDHREGHRGEHNGHGHHHMNEPEDTLYGLMRQSGHYLFHKGQGNAAHGQDRILTLLAENEEDVSQRMLQNRLGIQSGSISEILNKLEDKGMILRERDDADQRRVIVKLTESGKERADQLKKTTDSTDDLFSVLTDDEKMQLKTIMTKLVGTWLKEE